MYELRVYYHDILRYAIVADLEKVQELRECGYFVQVREMAATSDGNAGKSWPESVNTTGMHRVGNYVEETYTPESTVAGTVKAIALYEAPIPEYY